MNAFDNIFDSVFCLFVFYAFVLFHSLLLPSGMTAAEAWHSLPSRFLYCFCLLFVLVSMMAKSVRASALYRGATSHLHLGIPVLFVQDSGSALLLVICVGYLSYVCRTAG